MDCSPPGSAVHGIFQARVLEWGAIAFSYPPTSTLSVIRMEWNRKDSACLITEAFGEGSRLFQLRETRVRSLVWEDLLEKEMAAHSSILAWKIPWTAEPGRLLSMGLQRVGHE